MNAAVAVASRHDAVLLDLDGVVYRGEEPVAGAAEAIRSVRRLGIPVLFLTNNSSKDPQDVAGKLRRLGVEARQADVLTSAMATAAMLRGQGWSGRRAFVIGERGVRTALQGAGIEIVDGEPDGADLVVVGWDRGADYSRLRTAALLVQRGARLVATNADPAYPGPDGGLWPGAGALLAAVTTTTGTTATVVGKPAAPMFREAARVTGASHPIVVGDRLDTDVAGATAMGWDSMLVLTGASTARDLTSAEELPTYVADGLGRLLDTVPPGRFRAAHPGEGPAVARLLEASGLSARGVPDRLGHTLVCPGAGEGEPDDVPAAVLALEPAGSHAILRSVAVRPELRGHGLGLLAAATGIREARRRGLSPVALFTEGAASFFGRLGFRPVDRDRLPQAIAASAQAVEECAASAVAMMVDVPGERS